MAGKKKPRRYVGKTGIRKNPGKQPAAYWRLVHHQFGSQWFHPATWKKIRQAAVLGGTIIGVGVYGPKLMDIILGSAVSRFVWSEVSSVFSDIKSFFNFK